MKQLTKKEAKKLFKRNKRKKDIILVLENIQYARNVASLFRVADATGVSKVILTGISHTPPFGKDLVKASRHKERSVPWVKKETTGKALEPLKKKGYKIVAIEITDDAIDYAVLKDKLSHEDKLCLIAGNETYGITKKTLERCDLATYIPLYGKGGSLNVVVATGIILFSI